MSDHTMLDDTEASRSRSAEDYTHGDPLIAWLESRRNEAERLLSDSPLRGPARRDLMSESYNLLIALHALKDLADELSLEVSTQTTLSNSRSASDALTQILDSLKRQTANLPHRPGWIEAVILRGGDISAMLNWNSEVSVLGCLNDIFTRATALDELAVSTRPNTPPNTSVRQDFGRRFIGTGADDLRAHINHLDKENSRMFYARVVPVLQSSGTGKTRTVVQLSQKEVGLLICVRRHQPKNSQITVSEPPRDGGTAEWLERKGKESGRLGIFADNRVLAVWLIAMAEVIGTFYRDQWTRHTKRNEGENWQNFVEWVGQLLAPSSAVLSPASTPPQPVQLMEVDEQDTTSRAHLLDTINHRAQELIPQFPTTAYLAAKGKPVTDAGEEESRCVQFFQPQLEAAFETISSFVAAHGGKGAFFHLAIDECGQLGHRLSRLRRMWQVLPSNCWMLWMDTNTEISLTYGSKTRAPSLRLVNYELALMRPFVALPQDIELMHNFAEFRDIVLGIRKVTFKSALNWLPRMGRPLLSDRHVLQSTDVAESNANQVLAKLVTKICLTAQPFKECKATIALIAQRFPITLVGLPGNLDAKQEQPISGYGYTPQTFAETLVESHMRRLVSVSDKGDVTRTSGPSEPLLSLASAHAFSEDPKQAWSAAIRHIKKARTEYGLEVGEAGEEVVRLLVSAAMDLCWADHKTLPFLRLVNLEDFLRRLFIKGKEQPDDFQPVLAWAAEYWLNFTHVIASVDYFHTDAPLQRAGVSEAWLRQGAILGLKNQAGWDLLLPIYKSAAMPRMEDNFDSANLSYIPIQTKNVPNGNKFGWGTDFSVSSVKLDKDASGAPCTIWFDLRRKSQTVQVNKQPVRRSQRLASAHSRAPPQPHTYHILAKGHDSAAIGLLAEIAGEDLPTLLGVDISEDDDDSFLAERSLILNSGKMTWIQNGLETSEENEETDVPMHSSQ